MGNKSNVSKMNRNAHFKALTKLANICGAHILDGAKVYARLHKLETAAHNAAVKYSAGEMDSDEWDTLEIYFTAEVQLLFNKKLSGFFFNGDPQSHTLQLTSQVVGTDGPYAGLGITIDKNGYGILSPSF